MVSKKEMQANWKPNGFLETTSLDVVSIVSDPGGAVTIEEPPWQADSSLDQIRWT